MFYILGAVNKLIFYKEMFKLRSKICVDFFKNIIDMRKTTCYFNFGKMEIILKANLLKGRDAKPEGAKISVMLKKYSRDAGRFWKVSFFVCQNR